MRAPFAAFSRQGVTSAVALLSPAASKSPGGISANVPPTSGEGRAAGNRRRAALSRRGRSSATSEVAGPTAPPQSPKRGSLPPAQSRHEAVARAAGSAHYYYSVTIRFVTGVAYQKPLVSSSSSLGNSGSQFTRR